MKKRIAIMMFAGCVCLSVVGCGGKKETETTAATVETVAETQETDTVATEATEETVIAEESTEAESVEETQESETPEETAQADVSDDGVSSASASIIWLSASAPKTSFAFFLYSLKAFSVKYKALVIDACRLLFMAFAPNIQEMVTAPIMAVGI